MMLSLVRKTAFLVIVFSCILPVPFALAQSGDAVLVDPVLENMSLPDYLYVSGGRSIPKAPVGGQKNDIGRSGAKEILSRKQKVVDDVFYRNPDMPEYTKRAYYTYRETESRNSHRFAQAASEFQRQELREQLMQHVDDPEKLNQMISVLYGKPYEVVGQSGYVVNQGMGEIRKENDALFSTWSSKVFVLAAKEEGGARKRETTRGRTYREDRHGNPSQGMKDDCLKAGKHVLDASRSDLAEKRDKAAVENALPN